MGSMSIWHWIIVIGVVVLLFGGKGKVSDLMGDFAKGIKSFKKGMNEEDEPAPKPSVVAEPVRPVETARGIEHRVPGTVDVANETRRAG